MTTRIYNFSAGPAVLPEPVLAEVQRDLMALPGVGASILEISHRSKAFEDIIKQAEIEPAARCWRFRTTTPCCSCKAGRGCSSR